jgi:RNA polymerase sigma-70 factor (ECF subfamily)
MSGRISDDSQSKPGVSAASAAAMSEDFLRLYTLHQARIYMFIGTFFRSRADIDEVMQETAIVLWNRFKELRSHDDFLRWGYGIARLKSYQHLRLKKAELLPFDDQFFDLLADEQQKYAEQLERRREALQSCLGKLRASDRNLVEECYQRETKVTTVAQTLARPVNAVYQSLTRIRRTLHDCITRALSLQDH